MLRHWRGWRHWRWNSSEQIGEFLYVTGKLPVGHPLLPNIRLCSKLSVLHQLLQLLHVVGTELLSIDRNQISHIHGTRQGWRCHLWLCLLLWLLRHARLLHLLPHSIHHIPHLASHSATHCHSHHHPGRIHSAYIAILQVHLAHLTEILCSSREYFSLFVYAVSGNVCILCLQTLRTLSFFTLYTERLLHIFSIDTLHFLHVLEVDFCLCLNGFGLLTSSYFTQLKITITFLVGLDGCYIHSFHKYAKIGFQSGLKILSHNVIDF